MPVCPNCGQENQEIARYCLACGTPLAAAVLREERKLVTVLFADLVGFTGRAERMDPEDVLAIQDPYWRYVRAALERQGGTLEKFIGDAVVALFGAPIAHEDDAARAVRAAIAIRDWARDREGLQLRVGVTTGEALVRLGARPLSGEGMASGDVVNTAARVQQAAATNNVLVDETTYRATRRVIDYRDRGLIAAKGKAETVHVWEVLHAHAPSPDALEHVATPLVGRERELELILATLARVRAERSPQLLTLVGLPGIGKSRLAYELRRSLEAKPEPVRWRQGRSLPYSDGVAFWALVEVVKAEAGILETDSSDEVERKLLRAAQRTVGDAAEWVVPHLRPLLGLETEEALGHGRDEAFGAWRRFLEGLAEEGLLVLVFEDLHWADEGLLDFVDHLVEWAEGVPILVLCTARPEFLTRRPDWAGGKANVLTLALSPLTEQETDVLIDALLGGISVDADERRALLERVGGNPLYAEQFAFLLRERRPDDQWSLPGSVQGIISARLDALPVEEKALLQDAAVVGRTFWSGALAQERERVGAALHALERKEFIRREGGSAVEGEQQYSFRHVLLRDVAYGQIPRAGRASKHLEVARWVESLGRHQDYADLLAHHYVSAVDYASAAGQDCSRLVGPARTALVEAATRAFGLNAFKNAARYYERALGLSREDDPNHHPDLLFAFAEALHRSGAEQRQQRLQEAREQLLASGDWERAAQAEGMLAEVAWDEGDRERCSDHLGRALAFLQTRASSPARARVLANLARLRLSTGEHEAALEPASEALNMAEALELVEVRADALITLGSARVWLMDAGGIADIEQGLALALASNSLIAATRGYGGLWMATALEAPGDVERLRELDEESSRLAEQLGNAHILRTAHANTIARQRFSGEWDNALEAADAFIAECEGGSSHMAEKNVRLYRAYIRQARDDTRGALADIEKSVALWHKYRARFLYAQATLTVFLLVELGQREEAEALAREIVDRPQPWIASSEFTLVAEQVGYQDKLRTMLTALPRHRPADVAALAIIDGRLVEAADLLVGLGRNAPAARVRLRAIEVLSAQGSDQQAREQFDKAVAFYRSVGASRYIRQAEGLLEASQFQQWEQPAPQRRA